MGAQREPLSGKRWHFQHGPIDIVIGAQGEERSLREAHEAAWQRFTTILDELVAELPRLREPVRGPCRLKGVVARRMWEACDPYRASFITPMAAVAGCVAEELIAHYERSGIARAWINNGGDAALHLAAGESLRVGLFADLGRLQSASRAPLRIDGDFLVEAGMPVRGIATSGWRGRSFSLGIADSVTVLARTAAQADAAATMIANAVNVDDARIQRRPACDLKDDCDLGELLVTVDVPRLDEAAAQHALRAGQRLARELQAAGLIWSAVLVCQGWFATECAPPQRLHAPDGAERLAGTQLLLA
jgi:uncharacterized protein